MYAIGIRKGLAHVTIYFLLRPERVSERSERLTSVGVVGLTSVAPLLGRWLPWRCQVWIPYIAGPESDPAWTATRQTKSEL